MKGGICLLTKDKSRLIRLLSASLTSLMLAVCGVLYIITCIGIWQSGASPFTRDSIGEGLMKLLIPSIITVVLIIATSVLFIIFPDNEKKRAVIDTKDTRDILARKISLTECSLSRGEKIVNEKNKRAFLRIGGAVLFVLSLIYPIIYILTPTNFGVVDINTDVLLAAFHIILSFIPLTAYAIIASYMIRSSYSREAEQLRCGIKEKGSVTDAELYTPEKAKTKPLSMIFSSIGAFFKKNSKLILTVTRCTVIAVGVVFVIVGIFNGGMKDVLDKAVNICRECIGLG